MKKNINLLAISHSFVKKINTDVYTLLNDKYHIHTTLICPLDHFENKKKIKPNFNKEDVNLDLVFKKYTFNHLRLKIFHDLKHEIKKRKITHILLDLDILSLQSIILLFYSLFKEFKLYYFSNENNILDENNYLKRILKKNLYKLIYFFFKKKISKIFCYTNQIKLNLDYCGYSNKTIIIPLGYNPKIFFPSNNDNDNDKIILSYFGRISKKKGIHTLLKSLNILKSNNWILHLDVFDIDNINYFKIIKNDLKKLKYENKLILSKHSHENINEAMRNTNITVVPSEWNEQYGRVIQEAAACGSIVIGSNIGAIPEILFDEDFLFEKQDYIGLAKKIDDVIINFEKYNNKFKKIRSFISQNRTISKQAEIMNSYFS